MARLADRLRRATQLLCAYSPALTAHVQTPASPCPSRTPSRSSFSCGTATRPLPISRLCMSCGGNGAATVTNDNAHPDPEELCRTSETGTRLVASREAAG